GGERNDGASEQAAIEIDDGDDGLAGMNVDRDGNEILIEADEGGAAAARRRGDGALADPVLANELLDYLRDGTALQAGAAREIGARDGLAGADEFEDDVAIDVSRGFAGGELNI